MWSFYDIHRFYSLFSIDYKSGQFALRRLVRGDSVSGRLELYLANVKKIKQMTLKNYGKSNSET